MRSCTADTRILDNRDPKLAWTGRKSTHPTKEPETLVTFVEIFDPGVSGLFSSFLLPLPEVPEIYVFRILIREGYAQLFRFFGS